MKIGVIIPCYNEEKRLNTAAFKDCLKRFSDFHLCFVNDGSTDDTLGVLHEIQQGFKERVSILDMKKNKGKASAIRAGARFFYTMEKILYVGYLDADLSTDFDDFDGLVDNLKQDRKLAMVFGSRNMAGQGNIERNPLRKFFSNVVKSLVYFILRLPIEDTQCGAKVFRKEYIPIMYQENFKSRWLFDIEMFLRLKMHFKGKNIMEIIKEEPLDNWVHVDDSKLGVRDSIQIPYKLAQIWFAYNLQRAA